jgi:hypothetical protein
MEQFLHLERQHKLQQIHQRLELSMVKSQYQLQQLQLLEHCQ